VRSGALYCEPIYRVIKATMTTLNNLAIDIFCSISDKEEMFCNIVSSAPTQTSSCSVISATLLFTKSATASPIFRVRISLMFRKIYFQGIYKFLVPGHFTNHFIIEAPKIGKFTPGYLKILICRQQIVISFKSVCKS
jgi:hypothetical protein